ncbi:MAG: hypothetical protein MR904_02335 [Clostridia bacterium]|nr:hypothetical protein [Clostridia bacterium]
MKGKYLLNKTTREYILAKVSQFNYFILQYAKMGNIKAAIFLECERNEYCEKYLIDFKNANRYLADLDNKKRTLNKMIRHNTDGKREKYIKEINKLNKVVNNKSIKELYDFYFSLYATILSVNNGRIVKYEDMPEFIRNEVSYEFTKDVYFNLFPQNDIGEDLSYLYMRSRITKYDLPLFMSKDLKQKFNDFIKYRTGHNMLEHDFLTEIPELREEYPFTGNKEIEKKLYESVFPEFDFKYEDREQDTTTVYTMDWKDKYR